ncbi:MAG: 4-hydroxythreonine-4-phosphate dehydrogenase PdxA [Anaerolineae bacterium]|nr:4-hydroxythreonine-4-phosphate dehydrogenase PdxA [Anaerolineae bacterium]MCI0608285.1 4-hydroxythreonine-4-phosphate dehydrogenase PdxA [Anaerolineae bacterium]
MPSLEELPIAITMGDPCGIGPEIIARLYADVTPLPSTLVLGDEGLIKRAIRLLALPLTVGVIDSPEHFQSTPNTINVIALSRLPEDLPFGQLDARAGKAAFDYIRAGIDLALQKRIRAVVTAPINKEALRLAGIHYPGHTEMLADFSGTKDFAMMLMNNDLRVILVTIHVSLREAIELLTIERELMTIRLAHRAMIQLGIARPRIAVAGLNPHAGEHGLFGSEDEAIIRPAILQAQAEGIDASGPWPGDTVFMHARQGRFDIVVAQYHDQGLIPVKYLGVDEGVNVTVGLPFVRTSVDHGTAFDIAGTGKASHASLRVAVAQAAMLAHSSSESGQTGKT